jgi:hypothetical protein
MVNYDSANQYKLINMVLHTPYCNVRSFNKRSIVIQTRFNTEMMNDEYAV